MLRLLLSDRAQSAYFDATRDVALAEVTHLFPQISARVVSTEDFDFLEVDASEAMLAHLSRLSTIQGAFLVEGDAHYPRVLQRSFALPEAFVWGSKYQGKTSEIVTQLAINLALHHCRTDRKKLWLFDPMVGRGTSLLWAARYGLSSVGIEVQESAGPALENHIKKQCKLQRISHTADRGHVPSKERGRNKGGASYHHFAFGTTQLRHITGSTERSPELLGEQRCDLLVCDLPYGIQFRGKLDEEVATWIPIWLSCLRPGASIALIYNRYQPKPETLTSALQEAGARVLPFSAPHRMSESIVRDVLVATLG